MAGLIDLCGATGLPTTTMSIDFKFEIELDPNKWKEFRLGKQLSKEDWKYIRYQNSSGLESEDYKRITESHGGVFIWVIQPLNIPIRNYSFIAYIGLSDSNLKKSLSNFKLNVSKNSKDKISKMLFDQYASSLSIIYYENDDKSFNEEVVEKLIKSIQPLIKEMPISIETNREAF